MFPYLKLPGCCAQCQSAFVSRTFCSAQEHVNRECQNKQGYTGGRISGVSFAAGGGEEGGDADLPVEPLSKPAVPNAMDL